MALAGNSNAIGTFSGRQNPYGAALKTSIPKLPAAAPNSVASQSGQAAKNTTAYPNFDSTTSALKTPPTTQTPPVGGSSAGTQQSSSTTAGQSIYDLSTDPIVQKIQQLNAANYGQAVAGAQSNATQDIINSGFNLSGALTGNPSVSAALAASPIGSVLNDPTTAAAAAANPYSTAAGLRGTHNANDNTITQNDNDANLYYSSTHGNNLGAEAQNYLGGVSGAQNSLASALSSLLSGLTSEKQTEDQNLANTIETERENTIQNAIASGQVMLGYDSNGNPIFGNAAAATPTATAPLDSSGAPTGGILGAVLGGYTPPPTQTPTGGLLSAIQNGYTPPTGGILSALLGAIKPPPPAKTPTVSSPYGSQGSKNSY